MITGTLIIVPSFLILPWIVIPPASLPVLTIVPSKLTVTPYALALVSHTVKPHCVVSIVTSLPTYNVEYSASLLLVEPSTYIVEPVVSKTRVSFIVPFPVISSEPFIKSIYFSVIVIVLPLRSNTTLFPLISSALFNVMLSPRTTVLFPLTALSNSSIVFTFIVSALVITGTNTRTDTINVNISFYRIFIYFLSYLDLIIIFLNI